MNNLLTHDLTKRALKTFVQAFLAVLAAGAVNVVNVAAAKALVVSALAAGISAVWNTVLLVRSK